MEPDEPILPANLEVDTDSPEMTHIIQGMYETQARLSQRRAKLSATPSLLREIPSVGRYYLLKEQSYAAHRDLISDASLQLGFNPSLQPAFDALCSAAAKQTHETLSILRNFVMSYYFADEQPQARILILQHLAKWVAKQPIHPSPKGAQALYRALIARQQTPLLFMPTQWFSSIRPSQWNLPPLEESPFSDAALLRPASKPDTHLSAVESVSFAGMVDRDEMTLESQPAEMASHAEELNQIANDMASAGALTMSVEALHEPTKRESVRIAKEILDKLRVKMGEALLEQGLDAFAFEKLSILGALKEVVKAFEFHLHKLAGLDAEIYNNPAVRRANEAVGKLSYIAKRETLKAASAQNDTQMIALIKAELTQFPKSWLPQKQDKFGGLFQDLQSGMEAVMDRMTQIGNKDTSAEFWLGFSSEKSIGSVDPSKGKTGKQEKSVAEDQFYRQLNAQRAIRARQAAIRYTQSMQRVRLGHHDEDTHHPHAPATPSAAHNSNIGTVLSDDLIASMRNAMKTSADAALVATGAKANIQQVIQQKDQSLRAQRQRTTLEQINRTNKRQQEGHDEAHPHPAHAEKPLTPPPPVPPPIHKKKDHGHGV